MVCSPNRLVRSRTSHMWACFRITAVAGGGGLCVHIKTCSWMFIAASLIIAHVSINRGMDKQNVVYPYNRLLLRFIYMKGMQCRQQLQRAWTLKTLRYVKETRHKQPHAVWFCPYEMSRVGKFIATESRLWLPQVEWKGHGEWLLTGFCGGSH